MKFKLLSRHGDEIPVPLSICESVEIVRRFLDFHPSYIGCVGVLYPRGENVYQPSRHTSSGRVKANVYCHILRGQRLCEYLFRLANPRKRTRNVSGLQPAARWTAQTRPTKPRVISDEQITLALSHRKKGQSWKVVSTKLGVKVSSLRSAIRARGGGSTPKNSEIYWQKTTPLGG
jgi:hypothetical protein